MCTTQPATSPAAGDRVLDGLHGPAVHMREREGVANTGTAAMVIADALNRMVGLSAWGPTIGWGSFLTIDFGGKRTDASGVERGDFHLWVMGLWEIRERGQQVAHSEQPREEMSAGAVLLDARGLESFEIGKDWSLILRFEGDRELVTLPLHDSEMEDWMLFLDDGTVVTTIDGRLIHEWGHANRSVNAAVFAMWETTPRARWIGFSEVLSHIHPAAEWTWIVLDYEGEGGAVGGSSFTELAEESGEGGVRMSFSELQRFATTVDHVSWLTLVAEDALRPIPVEDLRIGDFSLSPLVVEAKHSACWIVDSPYASATTEAILHRFRTRY